MTNVQSVIDLATTDKAFAEALKMMARNEQFQSEDPIDNAAVQELLAIFATSPEELAQLTAKDSGDEEITTVTTAMCKPVKETDIPTMHCTDTEGCPPEHPPFIKTKL